VGWGYRGKKEATKEEEVGKGGEGKERVHPGGTIVGKKWNENTGTQGLLLAKDLTWGEGGSKSLKKEGRSQEGRR